MRNLIVNAACDNQAADLVAHGLLGFAQAREYLSSMDTKNSFAINDKSVQKISALIMEDRGDGSLVKKYIDSTAPDLKDKDISEYAQSIIKGLWNTKCFPYHRSSYNPVSRWKD